MPITTTVNTAERVRYSVMSGSVNDKELLDASPASAAGRPAREPEDRYDDATGTDG
jgi:hypothetical protein